jgi:hypothetical protein
LCLSSKIEALQKENAEYLEQKRAEAMDATALMQGYVAGKVEQERASESKQAILGLQFAHVLIGGFGISWSPHYICTLWTENRVHCNRNA